VVCKDARDAYRREFHVAARLVDHVTIDFQARDWFAVLRLLQFVLRAIRSVCTLRLRRLR
jgi:hypothetical protein